jgi:transcriptional regulator with XRE-family HTH domain
MRLRDALRQLREALDFTQEQMARRMGTTVRTIARWESGPVNSLPLEMLILLRHVAIQANQEALAEYFNDSLYETYARDDAELAASVQWFLPSNLREMHLIDEFLRRLRKSDQAIAPVIMHLDDLRRERIEEEQRKILELHTKRMELQQALRDLSREQKQCLEERTAIQQGSHAKARPKEPSGIQLEVAAQTVPDNQADWDIWWPRLSPNLQAIIPPVYSREELIRIKRLGKAPIRLSDAETVRDLLSPRPDKEKKK